MKYTDLQTDDLFTIGKSATVYKKESPTVYSCFKADQHSCYKVGDKITGEPTGLVKLVKDRESLLTPIYHGDNEDQEFWENEHTLLMRPHGDSGWSAHKKHLKGKGRTSSYEFLFFAGSAQEAADKLFLKLDTSKVWRPKGKGFTLTDKK